MGVSITAPPPRGWDNSQPLPGISQAAPCCFLGSGALSLLHVHLGCPSSLRPSFLRPHPILPRVWGLPLRPFPPRPTGRTGKWRWNPLPISGGNSTCPPRLGCLRVHAMATGPSGLTECEETKQAPGKPQRPSPEGRARHLLCHSLRVRGSGEATRRVLTVQRWAGTERAQGRRMKRPGQCKEQSC